jgi:succinoglycan biosynthesis transport protein ExoP
VDLRDYLSILRARRWLILVVLTIAIGAVFVGTRLMTKTYAATATVRVQPQSALSNDPVRADDVTYLAQLQNTYAKLATDRTFKSALKNRLGLHRKPTVEVVTKPNTELMQIRGLDRDPYVATRVANTAAALLIERVQRFAEQGLRSAEEIFLKSAATLRTQIADARHRYNQLLAAGVSETSPQALALSTDIQLKGATLIDQQRQLDNNRLAAQARANAVQVVEQAAVPTSPASPNMKVNLLLAALVGLIGAIGLAFLAERLQPRLYFADHIEHIAGLPVLGAIPIAMRRNGFFPKKLKGVFNTGSPAEEAFRTLRMNMLAIDSQRPLEKVLVTSAAPNEGKSTVAANLGASLAHGGQKVIVVDGDLRIPTLHQILEVSNKIGITSVLDGSATLDDAIRSTSVENLFLLPSGPPTDNPAELLASERMAELLNELSSRFDVTVIDSPAMLGLSDTLALAQEASGVLLVTRKSKTRRDEFQAAQKSLNSVNVQPVGIVVNGSVSPGSYYHYYRGDRRRRE